MINYYNTMRYYCVEWCTIKSTTLTNYGLLCKVEECDERDTVKSMKELKSD